MHLFYSEGVNKYLALVKLYVFGCQRRAKKASKQTDRLRDAVKKKSGALEEVEKYWKQGKNNQLSETTKEGFKNNTKKAVKQLQEKKGTERKIRN